MGGFATASTGKRRTNFFCKRDLSESESRLVEVSWIDWQLVSSPACNKLRMAPIDPFGLQAIWFFISPDIGVRNADGKRPDLC